jgi:replicative DNA helicase
MSNSKSKTENRVQELSQITRSLKTIAREFDIPIALSQLNGKKPAWIKTHFIRLKRSGSIEQDADLVIMLYRSKYYNLKQNEDSLFQLIELIIAKHRNGPVGTVTLNLMKSDKIL